MSTPVQQMRREAIKRVVSQSIGNAKSVPGVARSSLAIWQQVANRLEPTIGAGGVQVLFGRALHLASRKFPWLSVGKQHVDIGDLNTALIDLSGAFINREPAEAVDGACELLAAFAELLESLIGETLTERLLGDIWVPPQPTVENAA
jgi:hypothetical protein